MEVKKVLENSKGEAVYFQGTLTGAELEAVIAVGLNTLLKHGALPYLSSTEENHARMSPDASETEQ